MTRLAPTLLLLALSISFPRDSKTYFRYKRSVSVPAGGQACAVLDSSLYAHAAASLKDLRLFAGHEEVPYVLVLSGTAETQDEPAKVTNLKKQGSSLAFDLAMPPRPYTDILLQLQAADFIALAKVTGPSQQADPEHGTVDMGEFALFDLTGQHLGRDTTLRLQESNLARIHVVLTPASGTAALKPEMLRGAIVPPSRQAQTLYSPALRTSTLTQAGGETIARFNVPAQVAVERISLALFPGFTQSFNRTVRVTARAAGEGSVAERLEATVQRIHLIRGNVRLSKDQLSFSATLGANLVKPATVEVAIENGPNAPLPITSVALETRQRQLCFETPGAGRLQLLYGDARGEAPGYDYAGTFRPQAHPNLATLGPEEGNAGFTERPDVRPMTRRHPRLLSLALILAICLAGILVLRSSKFRL